MNTKKLSIYAVGDTTCYPVNRFGTTQTDFHFPKPECLFDLALPTLKQADILFGHLETSLSRKGVPQLAIYPSLHMSAGPEDVSALTYAGFDVMSHGSNNFLSFGEEAFFETMDTVRKANIQLVGVGRNIDEARKPVILERKGTKVGFLAYCSVLPLGYQAGPNKSGCAPMRAITLYNQVDWQPGAPPKVITLANKDDLAAMVDDIKKVRPLVDVLIMSIHWGVHFVPGVIAMYQKEVGYAAIDAGVDVIVGHHPHILKGIEVYKGKVIFYSLANFVTPSIKGEQEKELAKMRYTWLSTQPYGGLGTTLYGRREYDGYPDYNFPPDCRKSMVAKCLISNKKIEKVSYLPLMINKYAQPEVLPRSDKRSSEVFEYMEWCCNDQGIDTKFSWEGDEVVIRT